MNDIKVVAFKGFINRFFPVDFKIPNFYVIDYENRYDVEADCFYQINVKKFKTSSQKEYDYIKESGKPYLVMESSPFRKNIFPVGDSKNHYYRLGWNHFLRSGQFNNKNSPPDRWNHIKKLQNIQIKDWRINQDGNLLLCCQKTGDSTLNSLYENYNNYSEWIDDTIQLIQKFSDRHIVIRPHLLGSKKINWTDFTKKYKNVSLSTTWQNRDKMEGGEGLQYDFDRAYAVISYNSNSLVESICEGIPSFPLSKESIIWDIGNRIENLENPDLNIDRSQWLYDAGYMIWNAEEINNGIAWNHLKGVYFK